jgi:hypothetical protein
MNATTRRVLYLIGIVALGIVSRLLPIGLVFFDAYLGDALYAAMLFELALILRPRLAPYRAAALAWLLVGAIELFQLTSIPLALREQGNPLLRLVSVALGTTFSLVDIAFYTLGIAVLLALELYVRPRSRRSPGDHG